MSGEVISGFASVRPQSVKGSEQGLLFVFQLGYFICQGDYVLA